MKVTSSTVTPQPPSLAAPFPKFSSPPPHKDTYCNENNAMFSTCIGSINFTMVDIENWHCKCNLTELTTRSATGSLSLYIAGQRYCKQP